MGEIKLKDHELLAGTQELVVRQNRFDSEGQLHVEWQDKQFRIINYSLYGLAIASKDDFKNTEYLDEVKLFNNDILIGEYSFQVRRREQTESGFAVGLEVTNSTIPCESIQSFKHLNSIIVNLQEHEKRNKVLPPDFKVLIFDLCTNLSSYEEHCRSVEQGKYISRNEKDAAYDMIVNFLGRRIHSDIAFVTTNLVGALGEITENKTKRAFEFFREKLGPFIFQSPFTHRSFSKPRGYAGDFEMMNQIYRNDSFANSLFGACMENAVQRFAEPTAVRNRSLFLQNKIIALVEKENKQYNILSVASGPAEEVRLAIEKLDQEKLNMITFNMLDQDEEALKYAQKNIREKANELGKKININLINKGIKEILTYGLNQHFDLIYSAGLFDYFTDPVASKACKSLSSHLNSKGTLIIGNFNAISTNWFGMLALFDWSLILRTEADLKRLFFLNGYETHVEAEEKQINLFCTMKKME
jgi:hypothetical protein